MSRNVYLSIDLDVIDPAFAPGVTTPVPGGLSAREKIYITKTLSSFVNIGVDIMELNPRYDLNNITAMLAVKLIYYALGNLRI
ncbi:MAG: N(1)-aminopropylagmatine ureohydrolase [Candidatus Micrarchaeota archaeon]|nr:MAG: N(1)-aminopropylagmatine ureohydrolase [Candidatus Micrarchaeota archaeon]